MLCIACISALPVLFIACIIHCLYVYSCAFCAHLPLLMSKTAEGADAKDAATQDAATQEVATKKTAIDEAAPTVSSQTIDTAAPAGAVVRHAWQQVLPWLGLMLSVLALACAVLMWLQHGGLRGSLAEQTRRTAMLQTAYQNEAVRVRDLETTLAVVQKADKSQELLLQSYQRRIAQLESEQGLDRSQGFLVNMAGSVRMAEQHSTLTGRKQPVMQALERVEQELSALPEDAQVQLLAAIRQDINTLEAQPVDSYRVSLRITAMLQNVSSVQWLSSVPLRAVAEPEAAADTVATDAEREADGTGADTDAVQAEGQQWSWLADKAWWQQRWGVLSAELASLVRISHLEQPGVAMLSPQMNRYVRTEYRLLLMQARISLMSQDYQGAAKVLEQARELLQTYADTEHAGTDPIMGQLVQTVHELQTLQPVTANATVQAFRRLLEQQARSQ